MKLIESTSAQLELQESATSSIITASVFILLGIGGVISPLLFSLPWWASLIGLAVIALGALIIFTATTRNVLLRNQGESTVSIKRVIGGKVSLVSFNNTDVSAVRLNVRNGSETRRDSDADSHTERYRVGDLRITLANGSEVEIGSEKSNQNGGLSVNGMNMNALADAPLKAEAEKVAQLFGKQLQVSTAGDITLADIPSVINTVRESFITTTQAAPTPPTVQTQQSQATQSQQTPSTDAAQNADSSHSRL